MTTLGAPAGANDTLLQLDSAYMSGGDYPIPLALESETIEIVGGKGSSVVSVRRGVDGTSRATHAIGTALTAVTAGAAPSSVYVSATDPGAIGAYNLWLEVVFGDENGDGGDGRLWVRNSTDDGWNTGSPLSFSDATSTLVASPADVGELTLKDTGGSLLVDPTKLTLRGSKTLILDAVGIHLDSTSGPAFITGSVDPSADAGVAAPVGSVYLRVTGGAGSIWWKTAAGDTAWTGPLTALGFTATSLAAYTAAGAIGLVATTNASLSAGDAAQLSLNGPSAVAITSSGALSFNGNPIGTRAAHVADGSTVDELRDALIASGLMAAS